MDAYAAAKANIFKNQTKDDFCILNYDNNYTRKMAYNVKSQVLFFSRLHEVENGAFVRDGDLIFKFNGLEKYICQAEHINIPGAHNLENALAATALAMVMGIEPETIAYTLRTFAGVEHRIEFVRTFDGIDYINDSKGTNPDSTIKAIQTMKKPTVLILGGYDKHSDFMPMFEAFTEYITGAVLLGVTAPQIRDCADKYGFKNYKMVETFEDAVLTAKEMCEPGGTVLLSPACASWGMFKNFEERGRVFKEIVNNLK